jgi:hypothetical protein
MKWLLKYHKWVSIVFSVFILFFVISGIILNHRELLAKFDLSRNALPKDYHYENWNNAAVKSQLKINEDSVLIYGNIGIYLTDSNYQDFKNFNQGFKKGVDNHKIEQLYKTKNGDLFAGTYFGLFKYSNKQKKWLKIDLPISEKRIVDFTEKSDTVFILSRSHILKTTDFADYEIVQLKAPENYNNKVGLFKTLWVIHSGEIYGAAGRIIVDLVGLIMAFLTISGFVIFLNRIVLKKNKIKKEKIKRKRRTNRFMLKWHNKFGWTTLIFLLITATTGMFLRPPLLIPIANLEVGKIPFSELDTDNAWFDQLRRIYFDEEMDSFVIGTSKGFYAADKYLNENPTRYKSQPPASVMGITVFEKKSSNLYLIGSFEGLFLWNSKTGIVFDFIKKQFHIPKNDNSRPLGQFLVSGYISDFKGDEVFFDYNFGAYNLSKGNKFSTMPKEIKTTKISLWNLALEIHTARFFQFLIKDFYILIVPLTGLALVFILISGFVIWSKKYQKKKDSLLN